MVFVDGVIADVVAIGCGKAAGGRNVGTFDLAFPAGAAIWE